MSVMRDQNKTEFVLLNLSSSSSLSSSSLSDQSASSIVLSPSASSVPPTWLTSSSSDSSTVACLESCEEVIEALETEVDAWLVALIMDFF